MGAYGWRKNHSVIEWLFAEGSRFDFFQAVRLLETLYSLNAPHVFSEEDVDGSTTVSFARPPRHETSMPHADVPKDFVRFKSAVALNFPTSDISQVRLRDSQSNGGAEPHGAAPSTQTILDCAAHDERPLAEMTVNLLGLAGSHGPLDMPTTELIIERMVQNDTALKDFLDIFNHRLISLLYQIRKVHRVGLEYKAPGQDQISQYLFSLIGLGTDGLLWRMQIRDRSLLHYAGLLAHEQRSLVGLERILADYFQIEHGVKGQQFTGRWYDLDETQWTKIGVTGQNQVLGRSAVVLGTRVWDAQAKIDIHLGPLTYKQFKELLPTGWGFRSLCDLTRFYLGDTLDVSFHLILKGAEVPTTHLSTQANGPRLGWTSWLRSNRSSEMADSQVEISLRAPASEFKSAKLPLFFNLPPQQLEELIGRMKVNTYTQGEKVMRQGKPGDSMFAIRSGRVQQIRQEADGKVSMISILGPGECFGEMTLLLGKHRDTTVVALDDCKILELNKKEFDEFGKRNPRWRKGKALKALRYGQLIKREESSGQFLS
jgi:type VI secretion system protein ImpH